jgi:hypothetical protein
MGVSGTLETLSKPEKEIVEKTYKINMKTIMPSVFGANNLAFNLPNDCKVENIDDYYNTLTREIENRLKGTTINTRRAVLVFFENHNKLMSFFEHKVYEQLKEKTKILTEEAMAHEKEQIIN